MNLKVCIISLLLSGTLLIYGQDSDPVKPLVWNLKTCIEYARENNIQVKKARINVQESNVNLKQSKEALLPNVSAGSNLNLSNGKVENVDGEYLNNTSLSSNYSISANMTLFDGLSNYNTIKQNKLQTKVSEFDAQETENSIVIAITEAYLELLYANENLQMSQRTAETSKAQIALSENLLKAGSIAKVDLSQVKAQYSSDLYSVVTAQNNLETRKLTLKQLLELDMNDNFEISILEISDNDVMKLLPSKSEVYQTALSVMPEIQSSNLSVDVANLSLEKAKASYLPSLSLSALIKTGQNAQSTNSFGSQLSGNLGQSVGLNLSIPIYSRGSVKASVQKAKLGIESAKLDYTNAQKDLLKTIESLYLDAVSAQSKYQAALEQLASAEESYRFTEEQFRLGMKNTVELLTEKDNYLEAEQSLLQAKYGAVLSQKLLYFYQNLSIE